MRHRRGCKSKGDYDRVNTVVFITILAGVYLQSMKIAWCIGKFNNKNWNDGIIFRHSLLLALTTK